MNETTRDPSAAFTDALGYVRDIYHTIFNMFLATDIAMSKHRFHPYSTGAAVSPEIHKFNDQDKWLRDYVIRQYFRQEFNNANPEIREVVTLAAILFDPKKFRDSVPMLLGSRMEISKKAASTNNPYWMGQLQRWTEHGPDGVVRELPVDQHSLTDPEAIKNICEMVVGGKLLSVAIPLLEATDIKTIEARVIDPLRAAWEMK